MQSCATVARLRRFGFDEPCGSWQVVQFPTATAPCWKTNGPRLSAWQARHGASPADVIRRLSTPGRPCGSWHDEHSIPPRPRRCAYGLLRKDETCVMWQVSQSASCGLTTRCGVGGSAGGVGKNVQEVEGR